MNFHEPFTQPLAQLLLLDVILMIFHLDANDLWEIKNTLSIKFYASWATKSLQLIGQSANSLKKK